MANIVSDGQYQYRRGGSTGFQVNLNGNWTDLNPAVANVDWLRSSLPLDASQTSSPWQSLSGINDSVDPAFKSDFMSQLNGMLPPGATNAQISEAIQNSTFYNRLGSGSNPYAAAYEVAHLLGNPQPYNQATGDAWNTTAVNRSPEGIARANDTGGLGDFIGPALAIGALAFGVPAGLEALGLGGASAAGAGALDAAASQMGLMSAADVASGISAGTIAGAGAGAAGAAGGSSMFDLFDPSTWSNPFSGLFSSSSSPVVNTSAISMPSDAGAMNDFFQQMGTTGGSGYYDAAGNYVSNAAGAGYSSLPSAADTAAFWGTTPGDVGGVAASVGGLSASNLSTAGNALKSILGSGGMSALLPISQLASGILGANAAKNAGQTQAQAANNATAAQLGMFNTLNAQQAPYRQAGYTALGSLLGGEGLGPASGGVDSGQFTHQFNASDLNSNLAPNYQFMLNQGLGAVQNANSATGGLLSGNTLKALNDYAQNYAGNAYQNAFQNYNTNQTNIFNRLSSIAGLGQTSNAQSTAAGSTLAPAAGSSMQNAGTATAGGIVGANNALTGGLTSAAALYSGLPASYYGG